MSSGTLSTLQDGIAAVRAGDTARGRELLRKAAATAPNDDTPWVWLSSVAADSNEAIGHLRKALRLNSANRYASEALFRLLLSAGVAAVRRSDPVAAKPLLDEALGLDPQNESALLWRAGIASTPEEGIQLLQAVLAINPENARAHQGIAHFEALLAPKWQCPLCETPARDDPGSDCPRCKAVLTLDDPARFGRPTGADVRILKAVATRLYEATKNSKEPRTAYLLGLCYLNLGYRNEGVQALQTVARHHSATPAWKAAITNLVQHFGVQATSATARPARPTVFVVDDSPTIQKLVTATLSAAGYEAVAVGSGEQAVEWLRGSAMPKLFILDVNMPGMDGFQLCKLLRQTPETARIPVVFLTGKDGLLNKLRGQWAGAAEYLIKPFDPQKLVATVQKLVPTEARLG